MGYSIAMIGIADAGIDQGLTAIIHSLKLCLLILYLISTKLTIGLDFSINPAVFRPLPPTCPVRKRVILRTRPAKRQPLSVKAAELRTNTSGREISFRILT